MMNTDIHLMQGYNPDTHFVTPDRKLEQFLYRQGIPFTEYAKGETGWTYWCYDRTPALMEIVSTFLSHRTKKKEVLRQLSAEFETQNLPFPQQ